MDMTASISPNTRPAGLDVPAAQFAKAALRRLAVERLEPTPENYERAYRFESGTGGHAANGAVAAGQATELTGLGTLLDRLVRGLERGGRNWTMARRKEGVARVIAGSGSDPRRLQQRLTQLVSSWDSDALNGGIEMIAAAPVDPVPAASPAVSEVAPVANKAQADSAHTVAWQRMARSFGEALQQALPLHDDASRALAGEMGRVIERLNAGGRVASARVADAGVADAGVADAGVADAGADPAAGVDADVDKLADAVHAISRRVERSVQHRHHLFDQLGKLCHELTASLTELAENDSWVKGQCDAIRLKIEEGLTARGVRAVGDMLHHARQRHAEVKGERERARDAMRGVMQQMLAELGEVGSRTGDFQERIGRYAEVIEDAGSLESLTGVVREMVTESRAVQTLVQQTQARLQEEHSKATDLSERVTELEDEMRRLSDEVSTDQLTQIANRRGLMQTFEVEKSRHERSGGTLSIGLLDIDNFKRLNDELGHSAGDEALKSLAAIVSKTLRPTDHVARYGGEEFVVLLPETPVGEGEQILTRLQRSLTGGLFLHKDKQVFVTFSAGVTAYRAEERIEAALERADQALYEAKRTGKNRTCTG